MEKKEIQNCHESSINREGLPTYEAKELGLAKVKYDTYPYESSIVITGNEARKQD